MPITLPTLKKLYLHIILVFGLFLNHREAKASAPKFWQKVKSLQKQSASYQRDTSLVGVYCQIAHYYQFKNVDTVSIYVRKALELSQQIKWVEGQIRALHEQSNYLVFDGRYANVMDISKRGLTLSTSLGLPLYEAHALRFMGDCHAEFKQWDSAKVYYNKAILIFKKLKNDSMVVRCKVNFGDIYRGQQDFVQATYYYQSALKDYQRAKSDFGIGLVNWSLGYQKVMQNDLDSAIIHFQKVKVIADKLENVFAQGAIFNEMAGLYLRRDQFKEAIYYAQEALKYSKKYHSSQQIFWSYYLSTHTYRALGDYQKALEYSLLSLDQKDSMFYENFESRIELYKAQYEKDRLLQKQASEAQDISRLFLIIAFFLVAFVIILLYRNSLLTQKKEKQEAEYQQRIAQTEIAALRAQMNPHFIFNCLNSIQYYAAHNNSDTASSYLSKFAKLIRLVLENSRSEKVTLSNELETLQLYIEMEAMRFQQKFSYKINVAPSVDTDTIQIPPLLIQPFVENAIWHGLMHKEEGGTVIIDVQHPSDHLLTVTVTDDGVGRAKAAEFRSKSATKHKSFGLKVTAERIELINQIYHTNTNIQIEDLMDTHGNALGTKIVVQIPI